MTLIQKICAGASTAVIASSAGSVISYSVTANTKAEGVTTQKVVGVSEPVKLSEFSEWPKGGEPNNVFSDI